MPSGAARLVLQPINIFSLFSTLLQRGYGILPHWRTNLEKIHEDLLTQIIFFFARVKKFLVGGWWCLNPILVLSLSLSQAEQKRLEYLHGGLRISRRWSRISLMF